MQCNRQAFGWADDEPLPRHGWNPFALVLAFEVISSAFALFYLRELAWAPPAVRRACRYAPLAWLGLGLLVYLCWFGTRGQDNWCEALVVIVSHGLAVLVLGCYDPWRTGFEESALRGLASAFARRFYTCYVGGYPWRIPSRVGAEDDILEHNGFSQSAVSEGLRQRLSTLLRYGEYTITASLLYVAVLSIFVVGPPSWAFIAGFAGIWACNAMGLCLHLMHTELAVGPVIAGLNQQVKTADSGQPESETGVWISPFLKEPMVVSVARSTGAPPEEPEAPQALGWRRTASALFGVGTWHDHWVSRLEMLKGAWVGLMLSMLIVFYFGRGYLFNASMPTFVLFSLWNLVVLYCAFGFVATFFYAFDQYWAWLDPALDILSVSAKIPIAASVCLAFMQMPGGGC